MTNTTFERFNAYWPYDREMDALQYRDSPGGLLSFPESTGSSQSVKVAHGLDNSASGLRKHGDGSDLDDEDVNRFLSEIDTIMADYKKKNRESLRTWIQKLRDKDIEVDINRVTRLATFAGRSSLVTYLVDEQGAQLEQRDKFGRSAVFYTAACGYTNKLKHFVGDATIRKEVIYRDSFNATPLYYAAMLHSIAGVEFCLSAGARPDDNLLARQSRTARDYDGYGHLYNENQIRLLFTLCVLLGSYGNLPVYLDEYVAPNPFLPIHRLETDLAQLSIERDCGLWIHIPWTNGIIVFAILLFIQGKIRSIRDGLMIRSRQYRDMFVNSFRDPPIVPRNPDLNFRMPMHDLENNAVVFPCLVLQSIESFHSSRAENRTSRDLIQWIYAKKLIQIERTLDEAYYPSLHSDVLEKRNKDQVVSRECTKLVNGEIASGRSRPILTVSQFWFWKIENYVLSAYSMPGQPPSILQESGPVGETWRDELRRLFSRAWDVDRDLGIVFLLADQIDKFGRTQADDSFPAPLDIFETGVVRVMSSVDEYMGPDNSETPDINKEREFMHDISDIRSELIMINEILLEQERIMTSIIKNAPGEENDDRYWGEVKYAMKQLKSYQDRIKKIDRDAERIEKIIQDQLNLKRTFATIRDTRTSLLLGTAVIGFTIVTIIFAPIAFMATLFALPIDKLVENQVQIGDTNAFETKYIGKWFVAAEIVSLVVTGIAVWASVKFVGGFNGTRKNNKTRTGSTESPAAGDEKKANDDEKEGEKVEETKTSRSHSAKVSNVPGLWKRSKNNKTEMA